MLKLSDIGVVSKKFSKRLANMTGFRNILVHYYSTLIHIRKFIVLKV